MNIALEQTEEYANGQVSQISCTYFILINALMFALLSSLSRKLSFAFRLISFTYLEAFNMAGIVCSSCGMIYGCFLTVWS